MNTFANINDLTDLPAMIAGGYITRRTHINGRLHIYNYTAKAQYEKVWNPATRACRGLIADEHGKVVARPFPKFFNLSEVESVPNEPFEVFEKLDGSLGILYWDNGRPNIATRGSFDSPQAKLATALYWTHYLDLSLDPAYTYLLEIIHPSNRIVVDYGPRKELVLLAVIHTESGRDMEGYDLPFPTPKRYQYTDIHSLHTLDWRNEEGFVVRFQSGFRVKVKLPEYLRLHKLLTGISEKSILEDFLMKGESIQPLLDRVPDEFADWVKSVDATFKAKFSEMESMARELFAKAPRSTRKEFALYALKTPVPHMLFNMLDGKDYTSTIWSMLKAEVKTFACLE